MGKIISIDEINRAAMDGREDVLIDLCRVFDHESYFDPVFDPPQSFLDYCKKYWEDYYNAIMSAKPAVPIFYAEDETGVLYFYHGKTRIRVREHFAGTGRSYGAIVEDAIRFSAKNDGKSPLIAAI